MWNIINYVRFWNMNNARKKVIIVIVASVTIVAICVCLCRVIESFLIGQHQKSVIISLQEWENEYSKIDSLNDAIRAVEMCEYIKKYYWSGEGYYSCNEISERLENQYSQTLKVIFVALEDYSGNKYGDDINKWDEWIELKSQESTFEVKADSLNTKPPRKTD